MLTAGFTRRPTWRGGCRAAPAHGSALRAWGSFWEPGLCCSSSHPQCPPRGLGTEVLAERMPRAGHGGQACSFAALPCAPWCCEGGVRRTRTGKQSVAEKRRGSIDILRAPSQADWPSAMMGTQSSIQLTDIQSFSMGTHGATQLHGPSWSRRGSLL